MKRSLPGADASLDQGDLIDDCFILSIREFKLDNNHSPRINLASNCVLVLTQACELAIRKATNVTVAVESPTRGSLPLQPQHQTIKPAPNAEEANPVTWLEKLTILRKCGRNRQRDGAGVSQERIRREIL
jgi:hypothetical protein